MDIKKSIMQEHLSDRNRHEMIASTQYYEMGISKYAKMRKNNKQRTLVQDIADGIELSEMKKNVFKF
jgi:hypothetical protein